MDAFARLVRLHERAGVRFVLIGLAGANYYARSGATLFVTEDRDLLRSFNSPDTGGQRVPITHAGSTIVSRSSERKRRLSRYRHG